MQARRGSWFVWVAALAGALGGSCLLQACGSGTPESRTASRRSTAGTSDDTAGSSASAAADSYCLDGTCFDCGESFCMMGWYCDESLAQGAGCLFVPECGSESNCDCVQSALDSGCSCEERNGGVYVLCG